MKKNMGNFDRIMRVIVAIVIGMLFYQNAFEGLIANILLGVSGIFILTSLVSYCPLYSLFGLNTCKLKK